MEFAGKWRTGGAKTLCQFRIEISALFPDSAFSACARGHKRVDETKSEERDPVKFPGTHHPSQDECE
jgi:hypothetical protein